MDEKPTQQTEEKPIKYANTALITNGILLVFFVIRILYNYFVKGEVRISECIIAALLLGIVVFIVINDRLNKQVEEKFREEDNEI